MGAGRVRPGPSSAGSIRPDTVTSVRRLTGRSVGDTSRSRSTSRRGVRAASNSLPDRLLSRRPELAAQLRIEHQPTQRGRRARPCRRPRTSRPVTSGRTISLIAPTSVATRGSPTAPASDRTMGRQSPNVGRQKMSAARYSAISSGLFGRSPVMDGHTWYGTWITGRHEVHLDIQSVGAQPARWRRRAAVHPCARGRRRRTAHEQVGRRSTPRHVRLGVAHAS